MHVQHDEHAMVATPIIAGTHIIVNYLIEASAWMVRMREFDNLNFYLRINYLTKFALVIGSRLNIQTPNKYRNHLFHSIYSHHWKINNFGIMLETIKIYYLPMNNE